MKRILALTAAAAAVMTSYAIRRPFNDWQFALTDSVSSSTPWQAVTLPHDWSINARFDKSAPAGNDGAYLPTGTGWYRTTLSLPDGLQGKDYRLYFEGVYENSPVYVNGKYSGGHPYIIGDFVWTGLDYLGESGIGRWYYEGDVPGEHYHRPLFP